MRAWSRRTALPLLCAVAALVGAAAARATTVVPMGARALIAGSIGAVRGRVVRIDSAADPSGAIYTYVEIEPSAHVFGAVPAGTLVLRELGGQVGGRRQWIAGSPEYEVGESVLVFLSRHRDGALRTAGLGLGKFRVEEDAGGARLVRRLGAGVSVLHRSSGALRDADGDEVVGLAAMLGRVRKALAAGAAPASGHVLSRPPEMQRVTLEPRAAYSFLSPLVRWFEPDEGIPIEYVVDVTGDAALGPEASRRAVDNGLAVWSAVPNAFIELEDAGDSQPAPQSGCPDLNRFVFDDPFGEVDPPDPDEECEGVVAMTLVCDGDARRVVNGRTFRQILAAKVTFNDGFYTCPFWNECSLTEIATHEIGHTFGLGHSRVLESTMFGRAHFDGRCAALTADDEAGIVFIYPEPPTPTPTPTAPAPPTATPSATVTGTVTRTGTITPTPSRTRVPTRTRTSTNTRTATQTGTRTRTPSRTRTPVQSETPSPTPPSTETSTASATPTSSPTQSATTTRTPTPTRTRTATQSPSASPTRTASAVPTATPSPSPTATATPPPRPDDWLDLLLKALRHLLTTLVAASRAK